LNLLLKLTIKLFSYYSNNRNLLEKLQTVIQLSSIFSTYAVQVGFISDHELYILSHLIIN